MTLFHLPNGIGKEWKTASHPTLKYENMWSLNVSNMQCDFPKCPIKSKYRRSPKKVLSQLNREINL